MTLNTRRKQVVVGLICGFLAVFAWAFRDAANGKQRRTRARSFIHSVLEELR